MSRLFAIVSLLLLSATAAYTDQSTVLTNSTILQNSTKLGYTNPPVAMLNTWRATGTDNAYNVTPGTGTPSPSFNLPIPLPFVGGANNCGIQVISYNSSYTISTPTDDKSETWVAGPTRTYATGREVLAMHYVLGTTAGTSLITTAFTGTPANNDATVLGAMGGEWRNCGTSVGGNFASDLAATGSALTFTLSSAPSSGDLVLACFWDSGTSAQAGSGFQTPFPTTITAGAGFTVLSKQLSYGRFCEYSTTATTTSVQVTYSGTDRILGVGIVIKQGAAGTAPPATKYIERIVSENIGSGVTTPTLYFPCAGNMIVMQFFSNNHSANLSSITSSPSATWALGPLTTTNGLAEIPYTLSIVCSNTTTISPVLASAPASNIGTEAVMYSIANATGTHDTDVGNGNTVTGTQNTAANLTTGTLTPAATGEIIFASTVVTWHTPNGTAIDANSHTPRFIAPWDTKADNGDPTGCNSATPASTLEGDNALAVIVGNANTTQITFIWTGFTGDPCQNFPAGAGGWGYVATALN